MIGPDISFNSLIQQRRERHDCGTELPIVTLTDSKVLTREQLDAHARSVAVVCGWSMQQGEQLGCYLVVPSQDGKSKLSLDRTFGYVFAEPGEVLEAAQALVRYMHERLGPGRVWALGGLVHIVPDDGRIVAEVAGGRRYLRLRMIVAHDPGTLMNSEPMRIESSGDATRRVLEQLAEGGGDL